MRRILSAVTASVLMTGAMMVGFGGTAYAAPPIGVPSDYVYKPSLGPLHDYCTKSPESFFRADFRGPCARHDLCYERGADKRFCNVAFRLHLYLNCDYAYSAGSNSRAACHRTADIYYKTVVTVNR